jgi:hypothetical protein
MVIHCSGSCCALAADVVKGTATSVTATSASAATSARRSLWSIECRKLSFIP